MLNTNKKPELHVVAPTPVKREIAWTKAVDDMALSWLLCPQALAKKVSS